VDITWESKRFRDCSADDVFEFSKLRTDIFFLEQQCNEEELDDWDRHPATDHLWARVNGRMIAYARVVRREVGDPIDQGVTTSIGRVVVDKDFRGQGIASELVAKCVELTRGEDVVLHAQDYVTELYARHGFVEFGEPFDEAGIVHRRMLRRDQ
jgi:ElaA protein